MMSASLKASLKRCEATAKKGKVDTDLYSDFKHTHTKRNPQKKRDNSKYKGRVPRPVVVRFNDGRVMEYQGGLTEAGKSLGVCGKTLEARVRNKRDCGYTIEYKE